MKRTWIMAAVLVMAGAAPARAQRMEIAPFGAFRFGGSLENRTTGAHYAINASLAYGGVLEFAVGRGHRVTVVYSRQETDVDTSASGAGGIPVVMQYLHVGGTRDMNGTGAVRTFVTGGLGLLFASVPGTQIATATKFGLSGAVGVKVPAGSRVALRFEARGYINFIGTQAAAGTCGGGGCAVAFQSTILPQGELAAGINFRF